MRHALALAMLSLCLASCSEPDSTVPQERALVLPVSEWRPGNGGMMAALKGTLSRDKNDCLVVRTHEVGLPEQLFYAIWPADYTATMSSEGRIHLRDDGGDVVATEGDDVFVGGGYLDVSEAGITTGSECAPATGEVFVVQSNIDGSNM